MGTVLLSGAKDLLGARVAAAALVGTLALALSASAQVLARPGWAGSGVSAEPWWHRAVFYRIDIARFQASGDNSRGDLAGVTQRLNYLQSLGVDALILNPTASHSGDFDDLTRQAADDHLRVIVALGTPESARSEVIAQYLALARAWLNQGAAGLYVPTRQLAALNNPGLATYLVHQLRNLTNSFPGARILLADAIPDAPAALASAVARDAQLGVAPAIALATPDAASLRHQMLAELPSAAPGNFASANNLLLASRRLPPDLSPPQREGLDRALAAVLLASRTAVLIDYGQELGEEEPGPRSSNSAHVTPIMQWTPTNLTRQRKPSASESGAATTGPKYGVYQPYVKPLPRNLFDPPPLPDVELSETPPPVDPASLPGFTGGEIDPPLAVATAPNAGSANVAIEDTDPSSLLNLYRRLIQLHHENATLRSGAEEILDFDAGDALLWLRRAPAGTRTSTTVLVACNLSARPFALSLAAMAQLHLRRAALRNLLSASTAQQLGPAPNGHRPPVYETTDNLTVPAYALFVGELRP